MDCSTSEPVSSERILADFTARDVTFVDAPLARTPKEAAEGRLNVMVGAEPEAFARIEPILQAFARTSSMSAARARPQDEARQQLPRMGQAAMIAEALVAARRRGSTWRRSTRW
jgi:3-hydroxyisobutyrate dehydrogenase-like beta-hydroxyacid dehydrogenase